jgi:hypothetical protein
MVVAVMVVKPGHQAGCIAQARADGESSARPSP